MVSATSDFIRNHITHLLLAVLTWATMWGLLGQTAEPPGGDLFAFVALFGATYIATQLVEPLRIPKIFAMLAVGLLLTNVTSLTFDPFLSSMMRNVALTTILLRGGLGLDLNVIRKLSGVCVRVTILTIIAETILVGVLGNLMLDMPWTWSLMTGFALAAACAAITVPTMISLQEQQLGTDKGIPTIIIAAASIDDVLAITGFSVMIGFVFNSSGALEWQVSFQPSYLTRR